MSGDVRTCHCHGSEASTGASGRLSEAKPLFFATVIFVHCNQIHVKVPKVFRHSCHYRSFFVSHFACLGHNARVIVTPINGHNGNNIKNGYKYDHGFNKNIATEKADTETIVFLVGFSTNNGRTAPAIINVNGNNSISISSSRGCKNGLKKEKKAQDKLRINCFNPASEDFSSQKERPK